MATTSGLSYGVVEGWEQLPAGYEHRDVAGVAVDGEDRIFLICRGDHPIIVYDRKGNFIRSWGEGDFTYRTHGITAAPDGTVWCTDDAAGKEGSGSHPQGRGPQSGVKTRPFFTVTNGTTACLTRRLSPSTS